MTPTTKISRLREAWATGDRTAALSIAAKFAELGDHADAIRRGHDAAQHPAMYAQMKRDPAAVVQAGVEALAARYGLPL